MMKELENALIEEAEASGVKVSRRLANRFIKRFLSEIERTALEKGRASLVGFGTFRTVDTAAKKVRNPHTGETFVMPEGKALRFKASSKLRERLKKL